MLVLIVVLGIIVGYVMYSQTSGESVDVPLSVAGDTCYVKFKDLHFDFSLFQNQQFNSLVIYGEYPIQPGVVGKQDPFAHAFKAPQLLVDALIERKVLTPELVAEIEAEALKEQQDFGSLLIGGIATDGDLLALKADLYKLPIVKAAGIEINPSFQKKFPTLPSTCITYCPSRKTAVFFENRDY